MTETPETPPVLSPDGHYQWLDGQWQPVAPGQYAPPPAPGGTDSKAVTSLVLSILWLMGLGSIGSVILGHMSRSQARKAGREPSGMALAGLIIGYIGLVLFVPLILAAIAIPVFLNQQQKGHDAQAKSALRLAALAEETYYTDKETYTTDADALAVDGYHRDGAVSLTIARADADGYCITARANGGNRTWFYDSTAGGLSLNPCG